MDVAGIDGGQSPFDLHDLDNLARTAELHDLSTMIKVDQENRGYIAQRAIGSGFTSILFADCRSADEVRDCVRIVRPDTPEDGRRWAHGFVRVGLHTCPSCFGVAEVSMKELPAGKLVVWLVEEL